MTKTYYYFCVYFIQLTFLSMGLRLLDIPHRIMTAISKCMHNSKYKDARDPPPFIDTYVFQIGFETAYALTAYVIALSFSPTVPYVVFWAVPFFFLKYVVDKYNLSYVYNSSIVGVGTLKKSILPLAVCNVFLLQALNYAILAGKMVDGGKDYLQLGFAVLIVEIVIYVGYINIVKPCYKARSTSLQDIIDNDCKKKEEVNENQPDDRSLLIDYTDLLA